jgi:hypothetical protein
MIVLERFHMPYAQVPRVSEPQLPTPLMFQVDLVRKLISTMMVGQMHRQVDDVAAIMKTLSAMLGDARHLRISLATASAMASAMGGDAQPARDLLDEGMDDWPGAEPAKVSVAMALKIAGDPRWVQVCQQTLAVSSDDDARRFARQLLEQANLYS